MSATLIVGPSPAQAGRSLTSALGREFPGIGAPNIREITRHTAEMPQKPSPPVNAPQTHGRPNSKTS